MPKAPQKPLQTPTRAAKPKAKVVATPKKVGAPKGSGSKYTEAIAERICLAISVGVPLRRVCRDIGVDWSTVYAWCSAHPEFAPRLAHARDLGYDALAEEALEISDTPVMGQKQVTGDKDTFITVEDMLGHRKLQIETRLKLLACWNPKKYGNKVALGGDANNPIKIEAEVEAQTLLDALLKHAELVKQAAAGEE